ncbi:hypothetical protein M378DRAFT_164761 [Amanita muscaria Koide BX008]|uniref:Uncharacterized protein n=1 Tax=Amanita muscaria (strain Koide BX008) TaxID=946122 RepID=A0A0C2T987_AMAMK|nr:hypothetical protein M378DRAFT_164761 [Amanita muscaria Koide BX008]
MLRIHIGFDLLLVVYAKCCYSFRDQLSFRVCAFTLLETFVLLNEQKDDILITIYYANIVFGLATDEKAQVSPSTTNAVAFSVTEGPEEPSCKIGDRRVSRARCYLTD